MTAALSFSHSKRLAFMALVALAAGTLAACGGSTEPKKDVTPATITAASTDTLRGLVSSQINTLVTAVVKNAAGSPITGATVTFAVASGGGSLSGTSVTTDTAGKAITTWTLGPNAGVQTVTATVGALPALTFIAVASPGTPTTLTKVAAGDNQSAAVGTKVAINPSVKVTDQLGNPVPGLLVTFIASNGGTVTGGAANTDASGTATVGSWILGNIAGVNTLTATAAGISSSVQFTATGAVGAVSRVTITSAAIPTLSVGQTATVTAAAFDANNNRVTGAPIAFTSDNSAVATVNVSTGVVTAVAGGTANIIATSNSVTAAAPVTVIGHPTPTVTATIPAGGRVRNLAIAGNQLYAASSSSIVNVDLGAAVAGWTLAMPGTVVSTAVNTANTLITAAVSNGMFYLVSPTTHAITDSVALAATPVRMVMNSTGTRAYVDENNFQLETIDVASHAVIGSTPLAGTLGGLKMGPGDSVLYASTALGNVIEVNAQTGAIKRTFAIGTTVFDFDISSDGKTLAATDGSSVVTLISLATGGLSGSIDFGNRVNGLALAPDMSQLWLAQGSSIFAAPSDGAGSFSSISLSGGKLTVAAATFTRVAFSATGSVAVGYDDGGLTLVVLK